MRDLSVLNSNNYNHIGWSSQLYFLFLHKNAIMRIEELIKKERELTEMTQSLFTNLLIKRHCSQIEDKIKLTPRILNFIENTGTVADSNLRNVFLNDFYFVDIDREERMHSFAYEFADYITNGKKTEEDINVKELFSFTRKEELFLFIIESFQKQTNGKIIGKMMTKNSIAQFIEKELSAISDEISMKYVESPSSNKLLASLNDSAKLVFYIVYYQILLAHKKKDTKEKTFITKDDFSTPGFKEAIAPFTNENDFDTKTEKVKGKMIKSINERISLAAYFLENKSIKDFFKTWEKDIIQFMPIKDLVNNIDQIETNDTYSQLLKDFEKVNLKDINYEDKNLRLIFERTSQIYSFSIKNILLQCYAMYQCQYPSMTMVKELSTKIKDLRTMMREDYQFDSPQLKDVTSNIVEELESMYEKHKGEFTLELYSNFYKKQQFLFQLYKEYDYMGFLLFKTREKK